MLLQASKTLDLAWIQRQGLLAVKIGQMYALRSDLLPDSKCRQLATLLNKVPPLTSEAFQARWKELAPAALLADLASMEPAALASASLGQVHRARLKNGEEVVIKFLKEDNREPFRQQVAALQRLFRYLLFFVPSLERVADPQGVMRSVEETTLREMNLLAEMDGGTELGKLANEGQAAMPHLARVRFPRSYPQYSSERVLVSEYVPDLTVNAWLDRQEFPYEALLELFRIHGYYLFYQGVFHGDLHPGNVLWNPETGFTFLDNATLEKADPAFCRGLLRMILQLGNGESAAAAETLADLATNKAALKPEVLANFSRSFCELYEGFAGKTVSEVSMTRQMMESFKLAVRSGMAFPQGGFPIIKSLMYLDGMVLRCNPQARLLEDVGRFAADFGIALAPE